MIVGDLGDGHSPLRCYSHGTVSSGLQPSLGYPFLTEKSPQQCLINSQLNEHLRLKQMFSNTWSFWIQSDYSRWGSLFSISKIFFWIHRVTGPMIEPHNYARGLMYYLEISLRDCCGNKSWISFGPILHLIKSYSSNTNLRVTEARSTRELIKREITQVCWHSRSRVSQTGGRDEIRAIPLYFFFIFNGGCVLLHK